MHCTAARLTNCCGRCGHRTKITGTLCALEEAGEHWEQIQSLPTKLVLVGYHANARIAVHVHSTAPTCSFSKAYACVLAS